MGKFDMPSGENPADMPNADDEQAEPSDSEYLIMSMSGLNKTGARCISCLANSFFESTCKSCGLGPYIKSQVMSVLVRYGGWKDTDLNDVVETVLCSIVLSMKYLDVASIISYKFFCANMKHNISLTNLEKREMDILKSLGWIIGNNSLAAKFHIVLVDAPQKVLKNASKRQLRDSEFVQELIMEVDNCRYIHKYQTITVAFAVLLGVAGTYRIAKEPIKQYYLDSPIEHEGIDVVESLLTDVVIPIKKAIEKAIVEIEPLPLPQLSKRPP